MSKKLKGFTAKQIVNCNWVEFNVRIMHKDVTIEILKDALALEEAGKGLGNKKRSTVIVRLKVRISQLAKIKELDSL